jgi:hypothetical protein
MSSKGQHLGSVVAIELARVLVSFSHGHFYILKCAEFFFFCTRNRSCISQSGGYKLQTGPSKKKTEKQA